MLRMASGRNKEPSEQLAARQRKAGTAINTENDLFEDDVSEENCCNAQVCCVPLHGNLYFIDKNSFNRLLTLFWHF